MAGTSRQGLAPSRKQGRSFFQFPHESIQAHLENRPTPSLLRS